jgi:hypothetical protein
MLPLLATMGVNERREIVQGTVTNHITGKGEEPAAGVCFKRFTKSMKMRPVADRVVAIVPIPTKPPGCNGIMPPGIPE